MKEKEQWKEIPGYEGFYKISTFGRIISLNREYWNGMMMVQLKGQLRKTKLSSGTRKYNQINLNKNGIKTTYRVSILMGKTFFPDYNFKENKMVIDHINNDSLNDRLDNLQLITIRLNVSKDRINRSSEHTGVFWHKITERWRAVISIRNKTIHLGTFVSESEAAESYQTALAALEAGEGVVRVKSSRYSSKHKGVSWDRFKNKWIAKIRIQGNQVCVGVVSSEDEAATLFQIASDNINKFDGDSIAFRLECRNILSSCTVRT